MHMHPTHPQVLDVGSGSGYLTLVMAHLVAQQGAAETTGEDEEEREEDEEQQPQGGRWVLQRVGQNPCSAAGGQGGTGDGRQGGRWGMVADVAHSSTGGPVYSQAAGG